MVGAGPLAFVGGAEWQPGCTFDEELLAASGSDEVLVIPSAAAYENPRRVSQRAESWFADLDAKVSVLPVLQRREAEDPANADVVRNARFIYLSDGSALHLRSVLKDSLVWDALVEAWHGGAVVVGSSAGGMVLGDPMIDPRGGAFTLGLGLVRRLTVVPHWERWTDDKARRMAHLTPASVAVAEIEERTALVRHPDGSWSVSGAGKVEVKVGQEPSSPDALTQIVEQGTMAHDIRA